MDVYGEASFCKGASLCTSGKIWDIKGLSRPLLNTLLKDRTTKENIIWATDNYASCGYCFQFADQITVSSITGPNSDIVKPRTEKSIEEQSFRIRDKAEVFTPSWICNKQNNLMDDMWFGAANVFNTETKSGWITTAAPIPFSTVTGRGWREYVLEPRLEIACGEAPYLVSRYDTVSGEAIAIADRIGLLDRKLRVVCENMATEDAWLNWAYEAFKSIYGYDWRGDNVLLARENLLGTFVAYFYMKFGKEPKADYLQKIADILSWNIWQMDGLTFVVPNSCKETRNVQPTFCGEDAEKKPCEGCMDNDPLRHAGTYCRIMNWKTGKQVKFISLLNAKNSKPPSMANSDAPAGGNDGMIKFAAIVGNPPYQENIGGSANPSLGKQLFPSFMTLVMKMDPEYATLITPSRWFTANAQDRSFTNLRSFLRSHNHICKMVNYPDGREVFKKVSISGGVNYFLYKKDYIGDVSFKEISRGNSTTVDRPLFEPGFDIVLPMNGMISVLRKVTSSDFTSIDTITTGRNPFGVPATDSALHACTADHGDAAHSVRIQCAYERFRYIPDRKITRNHEMANRWKVFTSKMNGGAGTLLDGSPSAILGKTYIGGPNCVCSNALIALGSFENRREAENLNKYMNTKFFRFMLGIKKVSQVLTRNVYQFVPLQNFSETADIYWSGSLDEISHQLYEKYGLDKYEVELIESMIKPAEEV